MKQDRFYKVEGHPGYVKNPTSGTVLNQNVKEIQGARARKTKRKQKESDRLKLEQEVSTMKGEMSEIKSLLQQLLEK